MRIRMTFKTPDAVRDAVTLAVEQQVQAIEGLEACEMDMLMESRRDNLMDQAARWFGWGEYVTVEWDTEADTCTVVRP